MSAVRVLLVLDDEPVRQALRSMLTEASDIEIAGEATDVTEALVQMDNTSPDVVLIDTEMPGVSGVETMRILKDTGYDGPAVMLGAGLDSLEEALSAGALGYATKGFLDEELVDIIGRVTEGVFAFGPSVMGTPQGMRIALRYITGQAEAGVAPAPSPVPGDKAGVPSQDVAGPLPNEPAAEDAVEAGLYSTPADAGETATPSIELVISSPAKTDSVVKLYQWLHDLPEAEVTAVDRPSIGDTVVTVRIVRPVPMVEMLMALNVVSEVTSEPLPEGSGGSTRLRLVLNGG